MAGRKLGTRHQEDIRAKIQASQIINRLYAGFNGEIELTNEQVSIGKALLNKVLPDLKAIEHSGEVETSRALADVLKAIK
jgi:hypothetical protein